MSNLTWRKSTRSSQTDSCVEIGGSDGQLAAVRDSKNPAGPTLEGCDIPAMLRALAGHSD